MFVTEQINALKNIIFTRTKPFLSFWQIWNLTFGFLGIQFSFALQNVNSSRILQTYEADIEQLSLFWLTAPLTGMTIQPIIDHYSDQTWYHLGRRRPFFLVGATFTTIALILMPNAGLFLSPGTETAILSSISVGAGTLMIMGASINVTMEPFRASIGDILPDEQHTTGSSIQTFLIGIGAAVGFLLPSIVNKVSGLSNTAVAGEITDNVKFAFYIGAAVLLANVLWTIFKAKKYSPEEMTEFRPSDGEVVEKRRNSNDFMEIMRNISHMPKMMLQLGLYQFFAWLALYSMWVYSAPAIAEHVYGATGPASVEYAMAGDKVSGLFSICNFVAMLFALLLTPITRHLDRKMAHALYLCLGEAGLIFLYLLNSTGMMVFSMTSISIAWANVLAVPYAILSDSLPADKMGTYMGIFNFFIAIPQIANGIIHGRIVHNVYHGHTVLVLLTGGVFLFFTTAAVSLIKEKKFSRKVQGI